MFRCVLFTILYLHLSWPYHRNVNCGIWPVNIRAKCLLNFHTITTKQLFYCCESNRDGKKTIGHLKIHNVFGSKRSVFTRKGWWHKPTVAYRNLSRLTWRVPGSPKPWAKWLRDWWGLCCNEWNLKTFAFLGHPRFHYMYFCISF